MNVVLLSCPQIDPEALAGELRMQGGVSVVVADWDTLPATLAACRVAVVVLDGSPLAEITRAANLLRAHTSGIRLIAGVSDDCSPSSVIEAGADDVYRAGSATELRTRIAVAAVHHASGQAEIVLENANDTIYTVGFDGRFLSANAEAEALTGYKRADLIGMHLGHVVAPEFIGLVEANIGAKLRGEQSSSLFEVEIVRADGRRVPIEISSRVVYKDGRATAIEGVARDLTHRRRLEQEVAFRAQLLDNVDVAAYAGNMEGRIVYWNRGAESLFGYSRDEAIGENVLELLVPRERWRDSVIDFSSLLNGENVAREYELVRRGGDRFHAYVTNSPIRDAKGGMVAVVAVCFDLTQRRNQEAELERLAEERARLAEIVESAHDAIISRDLEGRVASWNAGAERLLGYSATEMIGAFGLETVPEESRALVREQGAAVRNGVTVSDRTERLHRSGQRVPVQLSTFPVRNRAGAITGMATFLKDVSEQVAAEAALAVREGQLSAIFEGTSEAIWLIDADCRFVVANEIGKARARVVSGEDPIAGDSMELFTLPENWSGFQELHAAAMRGEHIHREIRTLDANRQPLYWEIGFQPVLNGGTPNAVIFTTRDITARRQSERARRQAEESLRTLIEHAPILLFALDPEGTLISIAGTHAEKARASELIGKSWLAGYGHVEERQQLLDRALAGQEPWAEITEYGIDWDLRLAPVRNQAGRVVSVIGVATDVTERNRLEAERRKLDADYRLVVENTSDGLFAIDVEGANSERVFRLGMMNPAFSELTGLDPSRHVGRRVGEVLRAEVLHAARARYNEAITSGRPISYEEVVPGKGPRTAIVTLNPLFDEDGRCYRLIGTTREITERKRLEAAQRELDANYRAVVEATTDAVFIMERQPGGHFQIVSVNDGYSELVGSDGERLQGMMLDQLVWPETAGYVREHLHRAIERRGPVEFDLNTEWAGVAVCLSVTVTPIFDNSGFCYRIVATGRDITERRRHEQEQRDAKEAIERLGNIVQSTSDAVVSVDLAGDISFWNDAAARMYGYARDEVIGQHVSILYPEEGRDEAMDGWRRVLGGSVIARTPMARRRKDGSTFLVELSGFPLKDLEGNTVGTASTAVDITERVRAETQLREKAADLDATFASAAEGIILVGTDLHVISFNDAAKRMLASVHGGELSVGDDALDWVFPKDREDFLRTATRTLEGLNFNFEQEIALPDGTVMWWEFSFAPVRLEEGVIRGFAMSLRNVTDRRQTEETLRQAQKLESLAILAGGIAHDFNNLLVGILGNAGLALSELSPTSPARETIEAIETAGQRAAELARQMLAYSGKGKFVIQHVDMNGLVEEMAHLLRVSAAPGVQLAFHFHPDLPPVEGDATQLRQVIMNLVVNASDAIGEQEGTIAITTAVVPATKELLADTYLAPDLPPGDYVLVEVQDTGAGMNPDTLSKVFDPFFTTKFTGRGLGLAAVLGIMRGHRGAIKVESQEGVGTTFKLLLPAAAVAAAVEPGEKAPGPWKGQGLALVVDDEPTVRGVTARALRAFGFEVLEASDGLEGVEVFTANADRIVCTLLDMTMPRLNGIEAFQRIREVRPGTPIVLMSGYSEQDTMERVGSAYRAAFVQKPFNLAGLRATLQTILSPETATR